jgi:hypothetical protein
VSIVRLLTPSNRERGFFFSSVTGDGCVWFMQRFACQRGFSGRMPNHLSAASLVTSSR